MICLPLDSLKVSSTRMVIYLTCPDASEVLENGLKLGEMERMLLKKGGRTNTLYTPTGKQDQLIRRHH